MKKRVVDEDLHCTVVSDPFCHNTLTFDGDHSTCLGWYIPGNRGTFPDWSSFLGRGLPIRLAWARRGGGNDDDWSWKWDRGLRTPCCHTLTTTPKAEPDSASWTIRSTCQRHSVLADGAAPFDTLRAARGYLALVTSAVEGPSVSLWRNLPHT